MEQRAYQKWTRGLLLGLVLVLTACAAVVYRVDPCFYYRMPTDRDLPFSAGGPGGKNQGR